MFSSLQVGLQSCAISKYLTRVVEDWVRLVTRYNVLGVNIVGSVLGNYGFDGRIHVWRPDLDLCVILVSLQLQNSVRTRVAVLV